MSETLMAACAPVHADHIGSWWRPVALRDIEDCCISEPASVERMVLSPRGNFAGTEERNPLTEDQPRHKLRFCVAVARDLWGLV